MAVIVLLAYGLLVLAVVLVVRRRGAKAKVRDIAQIKPANRRNDHRPGVLQIFKELGTECSRCKGDRRKCPHPDWRGP